MVGWIAAVSEPADDVGFGDGGEGGPGGRAEVVVGASLGLTEGMLDLGECLLDRIEVRRVGRERQEAGATLLDSSTHGWAVMGTEVVGDHDLAFPEGRDEAVADVPLEARGGHRSVKPHQRPDAVESEGRDHRLVLPAI